jgi:dTDP-4-dehydrorhamnose 3,5-epimerase
MRFDPLPLEGAYLIDPDPFKDERGLFARVFCERELQEINHTKAIVQINHSLNAKRGAIRGMHFQYGPKAEIKMVKCLAGSVFDVLVDLRKLSPTFGKWHGEKLSSDNMKLMYIPEGFAHGFQTLTENAQLLYLHTAFYTPEYEGGVRFDDPDLAIDWPLPPTMISERDRSLPPLSEICEYF